MGTNKQPGKSSLLSCGASAPPVVLYLPQRSLPEIEGRIHLSRGTCPAEAVDLGAPRYVPGARVPVPEWRLPTQEEKSVLWSEIAPQTHRAVGIVRLLGPQLIRLFAERSDIFERVEDADTLDHPLIGLLLDIIGKAGLVTRHALSARIGRDQPGLLTMTKAVDEDARIGLPSTVGTGFPSMSWRKARIAFPSISVRSNGISFFSIGRRQAWRQCSKGQM